MGRGDGGLKWDGWVEWILDGCGFVHGGGFCDVWAAEAMHAMQRTDNTESFLLAQTTLAQETNDRGQPSCTLCACYRTLFCGGRQFRGR